MLSQTQVSRVAARFEAFVGRFPTSHAMARAGLGEVLTAWQGLGYPQRAARLHGTARSLVSQHHGMVPARLEALLALPGVGQYTARAVLAFSFDAPVLPVDVNVGRVLARAIAGRPLGPAAARALASVLAPPVGGRHLAQAFMDLGATVCRPRPRCAACPLAAAPGVCSWRSSDETPSPSNDPARAGAGAARRQSRFEGSDRQGRGRLLRRAAAGPIRPGEIAAAAGWPLDPERARRVAASLVRDGLMMEEGVGGFRLPD